MSALLNSTPEESSSADSKSEKNTVLATPESESTATTSPDDSATPMPLEKLLRNLGGEQAVDTMRWAEATGMAWGTIEMALMHLKWFSEKGNVDDIVRAVRCLESGLENSRAKSPLRGVYK